MGNGIRDGFGSSAKPQTVQIRPHEKIIQHWMAFHMRRQLTFVFVCPYELEDSEDKKDKTCTPGSKIQLFRSAKAFTDHLASYHAESFEERLKEIQWSGTRQGSES